MLTNDNRGFTLVELLIVIAILGVLSAIAVPMLLGQRTKAVITEAETNLQILGTVNEQYYAENAMYAPNSSSRIKFNNDDFGGTLRGFKPGDLEDLNFDYYLSNPGGDNQKFLAEAEGKAGSAADGIYRALDQNGIWNATAP